MNSSVKKIQKTPFNNKGIINLDEVLEEVVLPDEGIVKIQSKESEKSLRDALSEITGGIGKAIKIFLDHHERVNEEIKRRKKRFFLEFISRKQKIMRMK